MAKTDSQRPNDGNFGDRQTFLEATQGPYIRRVQRYVKQYYRVGSILAPAAMELWLGTNVLLSTGELNRPRGAISLLMRPRGRAVRKYAVSVTQIDICLLFFFSFWYFNGPASICILYLEEL